MIDGLAVVDKPGGMTSHDVVARCRKIFGQKKVGHAGTLDPDATGVLLIGLGRATRLLQFMSGLPKSYETDIVLGVATSTLDASGTVVGEWDMSGVTLEELRAAAARLTGAVMQVPPMVSAIKVGGRRLHSLARAGVEVERQARPVTVDRFEIASLRSGVVAARIDCSSGTYVRVLAADLGEVLGGGAHVRSLRRTAVGPWTEAEAVPLETLAEGDVRPPAACLPLMGRVAVGSDLAEQIANGRVLERSLLGMLGEGPWAVLDDKGELLAVYMAHSGATAKPLLVLPPAS